MDALNLDTGFVLMHIIIYQWSNNVNYFIGPLNNMTII